MPNATATLGEVLVPHQASWRVVVESADGTRVEDAVWTDRFELVEHGEYRLLRFEQSFIDAAGSQARHNVFLSRYPSLLPVHTELNLPSGRLLTDYSGRDVSGTFHPSGAADAQPFSELLERPAFDFAMSGYLALGRQWSAGETVRAPFFAGTIDGSEGIRWMELRIGESETVTFRGEQVATRVVSVPALGWRMWMVRTPPYVYRSEIPGAGGEVRWFELLEYSEPAAGDPGEAPADSFEPTLLDGVWEMVSSETIAPDGSRFPGRAHESFLLIADGHYSLNWASGPAPSEYYAQRFNPTDEEKLARYGRLLVNAGRLELAPGVLTIHPTFALVPEYVGGLGEFEYTFDGSILELVWRRIVSADGVEDPNTEAGVRYLSRWQRISP